MVDLTKLDKYEKYKIPTVDLKIALKVLRTVKTSLEPEMESEDVRATLGLLGFAIENVTYYNESDTKEMSNVFDVCYDNCTVPDEDVELTLKVIRTIRNAYLGGPRGFSADIAVRLSHVHKYIVDSVNEIQNAILVVQ